MLLFVCGFLFVHTSLHHASFCLCFFCLCILPCIMLLIVWNLVHFVVESRRCWSHVHKDIQAGTVDCRVFIGMSQHYQQTKTNNLKVSDIEFFDLFKAKLLHHFYIDICLFYNLHTTFIVWFLLQRKQLLLFILAFTGIFAESIARFTNTSSSS